MNYNVAYKGCVMQQVIILFRQSLYIMASQYSLFDSVQ